MLDPEAPDERRDEITVEARKRIEAGATVKQERSWGLRKMAYEINQRNEADYRFFRFEQGAGVLEDLDHNLKITDGILRFRIYKVDARTPVIDPPPPINLMAGSDRPGGGRPRRDGGGYDDRPPRAPEPEAAAPAEAAAAPSQPTESAPEPAESAPEPAESAAEAPAPPATEAPPADAEPVAEPVAEAPAAAPAEEPGEAPASAEPSSE